MILDMVEMIIPCIKYYNYLGSKLDSKLSLKKCDYVSVGMHT